MTEQQKPQRDWAGECEMHAKRIRQAVNFMKEFNSSNVNDHEDNLWDAADDLESDAAEYREMQA